MELWPICQAKHAKKCARRLLCYRQYFTWRCFQRAICGLRVSRNQNHLMNISAYISLPKANGNGYAIYVVFLSSYPCLVLVSFFLFCILCFRYEWVFDCLVDDMIEQELAMRASVKNAELLLFPSAELPIHYWSKLRTRNLKNTTNALKITRL